MTTEPQNPQESTIEKLTDVNAVIAYLVEKFPACFSIEGDAKPLKIGLFQDLAERLEGNEQVSKTQLRQALRRYTNSWRYLRSQKAGAQRVDLDGNEVGELDAEHVEHAQTALKESQEKAKAARAEKQAQQRPAKRNNETRKPSVRAERAKSAKIKSKSEIKRNQEVLQTVSSDKLKVDQAVMVQLGRAPSKGVIQDIHRDDVTVRLESGLTVKVKAEHIRI